MNAGRHALWLLNETLRNDFVPINAYYYFTTLHCVGFSTCCVDAHTVGGTLLSEAFGDTVAATVQEQQMGSGAPVLKMC